MDENQNDAQDVQPDENTEQQDTGDDLATKVKSLEEALAKRDEKISSFEEDIARLKRETKREIKKSQDKAEKTDNTELLERLDKLAIQSAGIKGDKELELVNKWKEDTGRQVDDIIVSSVFQKELEALREDEANKVATSDVKGGAGETEAKNTPEHWIAKGAPPTPEQVPNRKTRAKIVKAFLQNAKKGKTFYNE